MGINIQFSIFKYLMKIFKKIFLKNKHKIDNKSSFEVKVDNYLEIGKLLKEARIQKNITTKELSQLSKIPEYIIDSIENNIEKVRPKYPFIRSILLKLEKCLSMRKNTLVSFIIKETKPPQKRKREIILSKLDFVNTWVGSLLYFLVLILTVFILKKYFFSNVSIIEIQDIEAELNSK